MLRPERSSNRSRLPGLVLLFLALTSCSPDIGYPPVARGSATPGVIIEADNFQTPVTLDGGRSADPIDDPGGLRPLRYQWRISGDEFRFTEGNESSMSPVIELRGERPASIELTVTDEDGLSGTVRFQLQLTVRR